MSYRTPLILVGMFLFVGCERTTAPETPSSSKIDSAPQAETANTGSTPAISGWTPAPRPGQLPEASNDSPTGTTQAAPATAVPVEPDEVLNRFVGVWDLSNTSKQAKWNPDGGEYTGLESTIWALQNRVILIRDLSQPDGRKGLYISTYDAEQNAYPFWCFDSKGLMGTKWQLTWDASANAVTGHSTDAPPDWTSSGQNHFPDADTNLVTYWVRDETGELLMENAGKKVRLGAEREPAIVDAWKKHESEPDLPVELKLLDRMVGTWDTVSIRKPAERTPQGGRDTAMVTRDWILNGRFVMGTSRHDDGTESLALFSFDPGQKVYRDWWFHSLGHRNELRGSWDEAAQTLSFHEDRPDGRQMNSSVRFEGQNREVWHTSITDAAGKVYFDMDTTATRRAAAPGDGAAAANADRSDHETLQGTWGAVTYVQNGQGEGDAPIAPEDSAIRFVFEGTEFMILAGGNAETTPKGSWKLGFNETQKTIDLIFPSESDAAKGQTMLGVWEIDGDTLKMTYGPDGVSRPRDFKSAAGSKHIAIVFKRIRE